MRVAFDNYKSHTGINFKNVYLDNQRILTQKKVDRTLKKISRKSEFEEIKDTIKNFLKRIFSK